MSKDKSSGAAKRVKKRSKGRARVSKSRIQKGEGAAMATATASTGARTLIPQPHGGALAPYRPGETGNPAGRGINPGLSLIEEVARMWPWSKDQQREVADDDSKPTAAQIAAQMLVAMRDGEWDKIGRQPRALQTLLAWMDRWLGKVPERIELAVAKINVPGSIEELGELMATDESALAVLEQAVARAKQRLLNPPQTGGKPHTDDGTAA